MEFIRQARAQTATMILNADDLITCGVAPENRRVYFGVDRLPGDTTRCENLIDDLRICPKCSGKLTYVYRRYHHIGKCVCPDCGFHSPESDYLATDVDMEKGTMALRLVARPEANVPLLNSFLAIDLRLRKRS